MDRIEPWSGELDPYLPIWIKAPLTRPALALDEDCHARTKRERERERPGREGRSGGKRIEI